MIRQVTMGVATADPTETALARLDLVVDPPVGDQERAVQAMEDLAATTPQVDQPAASPHPDPIVLGAQSPKATTPVHPAPETARVAPHGQTTTPVHPAPATATVGRNGQVTAIAGHLVLVTAPIVATVQVVPSAAIAPHAPHATTAPVARNVEVVPTADPDAAMGPPRSVSGPKAAPPHAETTTPANASQKKIAIPSASALFAHSTRHRKFPRELPQRCLIESHPMN